jgi:anti-sigma B factor antagonist
VEAIGDCHVVRFDGDLGAAAEKEMRKMFLRLNDDGAKHIVFDMSRVSFLDSTVLGAFVWGLKNVRERGGDLRMFGLHDFVGKLFSITQLDKAFRIFDDEDAALASFA